MATYVTLVRCSLPGSTYWAWQEKHLERRRNDRRISYGVSAVVVDLTREGSFMARERLIVLFLVVSHHP